MVMLMNLSVFFACITFIYTGDDLWFKTNHFDIPKLVPECGFPH